MKYQFFTLKALDYSLYHDIAFVENARWYYIINIHELSTVTTIKLFVEKHYFIKTINAIQNI
jgi:hypothetical protein